MPNLKNYVTKIIENSFQKKWKKKEKKEKEVGKSFLTKILFYFAFDKLFIKGKF